MPATALTELQSILTKPVLQIQAKSSELSRADQEILIPLSLGNTLSFNLFLGTNFRTAQGQHFAVDMFITPSSGPTTVVFSASGLPEGIELDPGSVHVGLIGGANHKYIHFRVTGDAAIITNHPVTLHWTAYNGAASGNIALTVSVWSGFPMQTQAESNWCWAAVSVSMDHYYNPSSSWTQCQMANAQIGRNDCCQSPGSGACNIYGYLDRALTTVKRLDHMTNSSSSYATILSELGKFQPLGIRIAWSGGGAHFICASGHQAGNFVVVDDPYYGPSVVAYNSLTNTYRASGTWTTSYFTKR